MRRPFLFQSSSGSYTPTRRSTHPIPHDLAFLYPHIAVYCAKTIAVWLSDAENVPTMKSETILHIHNLLLQEYGDHPWQPGDPVAALVSTILSQNTNDVNRDKAFGRLRKRFPTWEEIRDAPLEELIEAVRPAGLAPTKAPRIQDALRRITEERGKIKLDFLKEMTLEQARAWLLSIPGIGPKTAAIVLLFALGMPAFPVDTHIHRVSRRLGLIPEKTGREKAHALLEDLTPPDIYYPFHLNLIEHGRAVCRARRPECERCVLQDDCAYASQRVGK
jgi:endonuclease-3